MLEARTIFDRLAVGLPEPARLLFWLLIAASLLILSYYVGNRQNNATKYHAIAFPLCIAIIAVPFAFKYCKFCLSKWTDLFDLFVKDDHGEAKKWFLDELSFFLGNAWMGISGIVTALVALYLHFALGNFQDGFTWWAVLLLQSILGFSAFVAGMGLYAVFYAARLLWQFGRRYDIRVDAHKYGVMSTGATIFRCYTVIALAWSFYVFSGSIGRIWTSEIATIVPMTLLAVPTASFILGSFFVCQYSIHIKMQKFKYARLKQLDVEVEAYKNLAPITPDIVNVIEYLESVKKLTASLPDWPSSMSILFGTFVASVASVWPAIVITTFSEWLRTAAVMH